MTRLRTLSFYLSFVGLGCFSLSSFGDVSVSVNQSAPTQNAYGEKQVEGTADYIIGKAEEKLGRPFDGAADFEAEIKELLAKDQIGKKVDALIDPNGKFRILDGHHGNSNRVLLAQRIYEARAARGTTNGLSREQFQKQFLDDPKSKINIKLAPKNTAASWEAFAKALLEIEQGYLTKEGMAQLASKYPKIALWRKKWSTLEPGDKEALIQAVALAFKNGDMPDTFVEGSGKRMQNDDCRSLVGDIMRLRKIEGVDYENFVQFPLAELLDERSKTDPALEEILRMPYKRRVQEMMKYLYETPEGHDILMTLVGRMKEERVHPAVVKWIGSFYVHVVDSLKELNQRLPPAQQLPEAELKRLAFQWLNTGRKPKEVEGKFGGLGDRLAALSLAVQRKIVATRAYTTGKLEGLRNASCQFSAWVFGGAAI